MQGNSDVLLVGCRLRGVFQFSQIFLYLAVIDAQKLVRSSGHVNQVGLALSALFVHELVHGVILGLGLYETVHHQEQGPAQLG